MAVSQRVFNSTAPFVDLPKAKLKDSCPSSSSTEQEAEEEEEEGKDSKMVLIAENPTLSKLLTRGTAEQVGEMPFKTSTIVAQAECETQDSQAFSPSCSERSFPGFSPNCYSSTSYEQNNVACLTPASVQEPSGAPALLTPRKKTRRRLKRKGKRKKVEKPPVKQRQRHKTSSGVPEQESGRSMVQIVPSVGVRSGLSTSCSSSIESSEERDRGLPPYSQQVSTFTGSSCAPLDWSYQGASLPSGLQSYERSCSSDSLSSVGDCPLAVAGLRGSVSQGDRCYARPLFKAVEREFREEDELCRADSVKNEGLIFYIENIQLVDSEYREGREYVLSKFIKQGSFGEVHSAQDVNTGFKFAVKKIDLKKFSSEEVGAWSTCKSPRVVKLLGVVREGPSISLFMDQKSESLGQLIVKRGRLPEDLSLHYHSQVSTALEYLAKKRVAHLDIKADNVLLSEDGRDTFLCDFGHAERLDTQGQSLSRSKELKGTETHMAPEVVRGEPRGAKADVWSSCCMLLHMLNGCQPWTRYYTCRLYLKIANEPPPLREIPPDCSPLTVEVIKAGLQKDPVKRSSASDLREKTDRALREVGGLSNPVRGPYTEPLYTPSKPPDCLELLQTPFEDERRESGNRVSTAGRLMKKLDHEENAETKQNPPPGPQMLISEPNCKRSNKVSTVPELELRKLERDFYLSSLSQLHSAEMQEQLLSCLSSDPYSNWEPWDKKDSGRWSLSLGDDLSSGVFSSNSQPDAPVFSVDLLGHTQVPPPCCFEGVDVCIRDFSRRSIRIREARRVKVGHIATGISDQISERVFTLQTPHGWHVAHDDEVQDSGVELCCVSAPDSSHSWRWRIRDGVLETRSSQQLCSPPGSGLRSAIEV
ncbi:mitogen-activated protein kinase kinase kinase 14 isoform X2 [Salarias fasciatus]|uniref:mitogen-activated protein kinase kinase kinase 14 isoform X2 n=1 Tax=Salarias fasciatus TaxID=181472 RepID=UPI001176569D|nr:mitogen-activated protein kinase kinase kinase 14-like isoform X2 [Salarias fasciatus]